MDMRFFWVCDRSKQGHFHVYWRRGQGNKADYYTKAHPVAHHHNVRKHYLFDPDNPEAYYDPKVNYYAPLCNDDVSDDDTVATAPETDTESDVSVSDDETLVASNCSLIPRPASAGEGVLLSPTRAPRGARAPRPAHARPVTHQSRVNPSSS